MTKAHERQSESSIELLLRHFSSKLTDSATSLPSTRCISRPELVRLLGAVRNELAIPRLGSASSLLDILARSGLIKHIEITPLSQRVREDRFCAVGLHTDPQLIDPAELLQVHVPDGVICYFTALQLHELTTQSAPHHHIAKVRPLDAMPTPEAVSHDVVTAVTAPPPLGSAQFEYQHIRYYLSVRDATILRRHQQRFLNAFSRVRVTTLEQTLIDTLHRPMNAGGPSVVFEAWQAARGKFDDTVLVDLLLQIKHPLLARRVGYMLEQTFGSPSRASAELNKHALSELVYDASEPASLIAFMPYKTHNARWQLLVP